MLQYKYGGGNKVELTAPVGGWKAGQVVVAGKLIGVCPIDAVENKLVGLAIDGNFDGDAVASEIWAVGEELYVIVASGTLTKTPTNNQFFGRALNAKVVDEKKARAVLVQRSPA